MIGLSAGFEVWRQAGVSIIGVIGERVLRDQGAAAQAERPFATITGEGPSNDAMVNEDLQRQGPSRVKLGNCLNGSDSAHFFHFFMPIPGRPVGRDRPGANAAQTGLQSRMQTGLQKSVVSAILSTVTIIYYGRIHLELSCTPSADDRLMYVQTACSRGWTSETTKKFETNGLLALTLSSKGGEGTYARDS